MQEKGHILEILEKAKIAIKDEDVLTIKDLSNQTVHSASIYQDADNIAIAIVLYAISKIIERTNYKDYPDWKKFKKNYEVSIDRAIIALRRDDLEVYREQIDNIREFVKRLSGGFKSHVEDVFRKAQINKGSRLYEHGLSLEKTAKILGITVWELSQYVGQTGIADVNLAYTLDLRQRIKNTEDIFKK